VAGEKTSPVRKQRDSTTGDKSISGDVVSAHRAGSARKAHVGGSIGDKAPPWVKLASSIRVRFKWIH
jgi:hypothetical protein